MYGKAIQVSWVLFGFFFLLYSVIVNGLEKKKKGQLFTVFAIMQTMHHAQRCLFCLLTFCHNTIFKHKMLVMKSQDFWSSSSYDNVHSWGCSTRSFTVWLDSICYRWRHGMLLYILKIIITSLKTTFSRLCNKLAANCNSGN